MNTPGPCIPPEETPRQMEESIARTRAIDAEARLQRNLRKSRERQIYVGSYVECGLTPKEAWWAGARAGLGVPEDMPREEVAALLAKNRNAKEKEG